MPNPDSLNLGPESRVCSAHTNHHQNIGLQSSRMMQLLRGVQDKSWFGDSETPESSKGGQTQGLVGNSAALSSQTWPRLCVQHMPSALPCQQSARTFSCTVFTPCQTQSPSPHPSVSHRHKATQPISMLGHYSEMVGVKSQLERL